jgi:(2Fe-2S) ferredoxin
MQRNPPTPFYRTHIFICTNQVDDPRCCGQRNSDALFLHLRRVVHRQGLHGVAVTKTGCMGRCMSGPSLVIYPDNVWYAPHDLVDVEAIVTEHVQAGRVVERLLMPAIEPPLPGYGSKTPEPIPNQ